MTAAKNVCRRFIHVKKVVYLNLVSDYYKILKIEWSSLLQV
jgi:hypothetical protein